MRYLCLAILVAWTFLVGTGFAQTAPAEPLVGSAAVAKFITALRQSPEPGLNALAATATAGSPRFIFVPGILGSQISIKRAGAAGFTDEWGGSNDIFKAGDLSAQPGDEVSATPLTNVSYIVGHQDIYGAALSEIARYDQADSSFLSEFGYDWRQDNMVSAQGLQDWICSKKTALAGHPMIFLSHSMGGLVTTYWYEHDRLAGCRSGQQVTDSSWIDVDQIIFLGTPFYGSPKAIEAFSDGYLLKANHEPSLFGALLRGFDENTISRSLNLYGADFRSAYELLPIYRESCFKGTSTLPAPAFFRRPDGTDVGIDGLFDAGSWKDWHWPSHMPPDIAADAYYADFLPDALAKAKTFLCDLAAYNIGQHVKVTYIYGKLDGPSTPLAYQFVRNATSGALQLVDCSMGDASCESDGIGDGVVPEAIARDVFRADADSARATPQDHGSLLSSPQLSSYIGDRLDDISRGAVRAALLAAPPKLAPDIFGVAANEAIFLPADTTFNDPADLANGFIAKSNAAVASKLGLSPNDFVKLATASSDAVAVSQFTSIAKQLGATPMQTLPGWLKAGELQRNAGNFGSAVDSFSNALDASKEASAAQKKMIFTDRGELLLKLKNYDAAKFDQDWAAKLGEGT